MSTRNLTAAAILDIDAKAIQLGRVPDSPKFENHSFCVGYAISCVMRTSPKSKDEKILELRRATKAAYYAYYNRGRRDGPLPEPKQCGKHQKHDQDSDQTRDWPVSWEPIQEELDWSTGTPFMAIALEQMSP
jgi:hypothetical protein